MNVNKIVFLAAFLITYTQGSLFKVTISTSEEFAQQNNVSRENQNITQNKNLDSNFTETVENRNPNETKSTKAVKSRRKITPIMFVKPHSEDDTYCNSMDDFPNIFTDEQRKYGAIIICIVVGIYCFTLLAIICDNYFLPCVERICETLHLSQDVAAATFMAMATSAPELFVNIIGTFVTESDIGIGTIVGSSMFNTLGVAALGSLAASAPIKVDWWPVTRDCTLYIIAISMLVVMTWDGVIYWYEGLTLFVVYFFYFTIMFNNQRISRIFRKCIDRCSSKPTASKEELALPEKHEIFYIEEPRKSYPEFQDCEKIKMEGKVKEEPLKRYSESKDCEKAEEEDREVSEIGKLCIMPEGPWHRKLFFIYTWPLKLLLAFSVPDPKTRPRLFPITFIVCIIFIGGNSYIISWMITIIGNTFGISDSVLGLTFLAAGGCLPEAISIIIMTRRGEGSMGVSNALGANTMNILLSLGLPWFVKTMVIDGAANGSFIEISSGSIEYTILGLILASGSLFATLFFNKFYLSKRTGVILIIVYLLFLSFAIVSELLFIESKPC